MQQSSLARMQRNEDQRRSNEMYQREIYASFIDDVTDLLLSSSFSGSNRQHVLHIEVRMLAALRNLDIHPKHELVSFLYKLQLITTKDSNTDDDVENYRLNTHGADLNGVQFVGSSIVDCDLRYISLQGIYAVNSSFINCDIEKSSFIDSMLQQSSFANSMLFETKFWRSYLEEANFSGADLLRTDFKGASLQRANFYQANLIAVDFTNADLLSAHDLTDEKLNTRNVYDEVIILTNARFLNGSFGPIDSSNLVQNGNAEQECMMYTDETETWLTTIELNTPVLLYNWTQNRNYSHNVNMTDHCSFVFHSSEQKAYQYLDISEFSLLISTHRAYCNLSLYMGCTSSNDTITIYIRFWTDKNIYLETHSLKFVKGGFDSADTIQIIPLHATEIELGINAKFHDTNTVNDNYCLIDNIHLNIFESVEKVF